MNISFALTTEQVRRRIKLETRRLNWENLVPGQPLNGMVKCQGLKKNEHPEFITAIRTVHVRRERLDKITPDAVVREGFPNLSPAEFVGMFCKHNGCQPSTKVTVIAFEYPWRVFHLRGGCRSDDSFIWWATSPDVVSFQWKGHLVTSIQPCLDRF